MNRVAALLAACQPFLECDVVGQTRRCWPACDSPERQALAAAVEALAELRPEDVPAEPKTEREYEALLREKDEAIAGLMRQIYHQKDQLDALHRKRVLAGRS